MLNLNVFRLSTRVTVLMGAVVYLLACGHILVNRLVLLPDSVLRQMFDVGFEGNIPTWINSLYWFAVGFSAFCCYTCERGQAFRWPWVAIGLIFVAASCDETAEIHENVGSALQEIVMDDNLRQLSETSPGSPWIGYYAPILVVVVGLIAVFLYRRLNTLRSRIVVACGFACFVIAITMDHFQGLPDPTRIHIASSLGVQKHFLVEASILFEEVCELSGCVLLTNAFLDYAIKLKESMIGQSSTTSISRESSELDSQLSWQLSSESADEVAPE